MINSMTAFSRQTLDCNYGRLVWEMRSVNHRFLEISLRLPDTFKPLEKAIRDTIQSKVKRGKVDVVLKYFPGDQVDYDYTLNENVIGKLKGLHDTIRQQFEPQPVPVSFTDLINLQGVLQIQEANLDEINAIVLDLLNTALKDMSDTRRREGDNVKEFMLSCLQEIGQQVELVKGKVPEIRAQQRERLEAKLTELDVDINRERLEQEIVWWAQKSDIAEELQRLDTHLEEATRILKQGGVVGRRLDFLMQEFNREANTLASKSAAITMTQAAVELKVLIEQMREQVQNIE